MERPRPRVQEFDPSAFVIRANTEMFVTNRQDWIFAWFETKEQSLKKAEKILQDLVDLHVRRCPTWHRVLAGMVIYYPLFKWRRVFVTWSWKTLIIPFLLLVTFPLRWSFKKLRDWLKDNEDLVHKGFSCIPKMFKCLLIACVLLGLWIAIDHGYQRDVADAAKSVATAVVIEAPLEVKQSVIYWHSERVRKHSEAELQAQQEQLEAQRLIERQKKWDKENPEKVAQFMAEQERIMAEQERKRLEQAQWDRERAEYKWKKRALWALEALKDIGILFLGCIIFILVAGSVVMSCWLLVLTIKPLKRLLIALDEGIFRLITLCLVGSEKHFPVLYRWTERFLTFCFVKFPILVRNGISFIKKFGFLIKYGWDWAWGKLCPAMSVQGAQTMLEDIQSQLAQLHAAEDAAAQPHQVTASSSPEGGVTD